MAASFTTTTYPLWGTFADVPSLPTGDSRLQPGALAWVNSESAFYAHNGELWVPTNTGITELTGDVVTQPGSGSQSASVQKLNGNPVSAEAPVEGQVLTWNGLSWVPEIVPASFQSVVVNATATGGASLVSGSLYFPQPRDLSGSSAAYIGGSTVSDIVSLSLVPSSGGASVATWVRTGVLSNQLLSSGGTIAAAGWYDLILQCTSGSGVAFCKGLYLI